jgi:ubiquinone/menaquinone biosynthesis C-methylase UbiE
MMTRPKQAVWQFWDEAACGEVYAVGSTLAEQFENHARARYALEPYIHPFARFDGKGKDVLEVGIGMGADHLEWAKSKPTHLVGLDFSSRAIDCTRRRLALAGLESELIVGDAEDLPFHDASFDIVYSWGVLHHTPDTQEAVRQVHRVLRPGGEARIMVYHRPSLVGLMLWARYALLAGSPLRTVTDVYAHHLESPGTKGYTVEEGHMLARQFAVAEVRSQLSFGDLLEGAVGQQHGGRVLDAAKGLWPRPVIKRLLPGLGLALLIRAVK